MTTKQKPVDPTKMYLSTDAVTFNDGTVIRLGERRSGSDPVVVDHPEWWVLETSTSPEQLHAQRIREQEAVIRQGRATAPDPWKVQIGTAQRPEVVTVVAEYVGPVGRDGTPTRVVFGDRLRADDRLVQDAPPGVFMSVEEAVARFEGVVA